MKKIKIKSSCSYTLKAYTFYLESILKSLSIKYSIFNLPKEEQKFTLLKSPHVYKKAKEQFKINMFKVTISVESLDNSQNLNKLVPFLINKPKAIFIKVKS
jgi:ribosomal protein S10